MLNLTLFINTLLILFLILFRLLILTLPTFILFHSLLVLFKKILRSFRYFPSLLNFLSSCMLYCVDLFILLFTLILKTHYFFVSSVVSKFSNILIYFDRILVILLHSVSLSLSLYCSVFQRLRFTWILCFFFLFILSLSFGFSYLHSWLRFCVIFLGQTVLSISLTLFLLFLYIFV